MPVSVADAIFWIAVASCTVAQLGIVRSVVISPTRPPDAPSSSSALRRVREIAWAVLPGIALAVVFVFTWRAMHTVQVAASALAALAR